MKTNVNPKTGIAYGYILSHALDPEIVDTLLFGVQAKNLTYEEAKKEFVSQRRRERDSDMSLDEFDEDRAAEEFADRYQANEETIEGEYQGVKYQSSWLGGALHFFIFESPHVKGHAPCSPCVPGAGDLHHAGELQTYDVPDDWRA